MAAHSNTIPSHSHMMVWLLTVTPFISLPGFRIGMIITLCHISGICPVEIEDVREKVDGAMSERLEVKGARPF